MTRVVVLDTGPLGLLTNPRQTPDVVACTAWLRSILAAGARVVLPEIVDYELRRELLRAGKQTVFGVSTLRAARWTTYH